VFIRFVGDPTMSRQSPRDRLVNDTTTTTIDEIPYERKIPSSRASPRLIRRHSDASLFQSHQTFSVKRTARGTTLAQIYLLDWYHSIVNMRTPTVVLLIVVIYYLLFVSFALALWNLPPTCDTGISSFHEAFMLSVETIMTIGYGTRDIYFNDCRSAAFVISIGAVISLMVNAIVFGLFFVRLSRTTSRSRSVIFSNKAIIRWHRGRVYLQFRVCDIRSHQLLGVAVRVYCIRHEQRASKQGLDGKTAFYQVRNMRLIRPDDALNSALFIALPALAVHHIDVFSPLRPDRPDERASNFPQFPCYDRREQDLLTFTCWECAHAFRDRVDFEFHKCQPGAPILDGSLTPTLKPAQPRAREVSPGDLAARQSARMQKEQNALEKHMIDNNIEILVLVEGADSTTSGMMQARHSYRITDGDILFQREFAPCVNVVDKGAEIDFDLFHETEPVEDDDHWEPCVSHS
jgi:hypothetical protein